MIGSLHLRDVSKQPEGREQIQEMQAHTLRVLLALFAIGYFTIHPFLTFFLPHAQSVRLDTMLLLVPCWLLPTYLLLARRPRTASYVLVAGAFVSVVWLIGYVGYPGHIGIGLFTIPAMIAAVSLRPLAGFLVSLAAGATAGGMAWLGFGAVSAGDALATTCLAALAVFVVWTPMRHLFVVISWYEQSYLEAENKAKEAREHRARLVQTQQQLAAALHRVERANGALAIAWRAASEAERARMEFATNISHELRTPLNMIVNYAEMMLASPRSYGGKNLPVAYRADMKAVYRSAQHLLGLTDDVLDLARLGVGRVGLFREETDLGQVVQEAVILVAEYLESKGLQLVLNTPAGLPRVPVDRLRIRQVLVNLLANAARFTEKGRVVIEIVGQPEEIRLAVSDTGRGMSAEQLGQVFQRFAKVEGTRPSGYGGAGVGLAISKRFVELHGGEMGVDSVFGRGTTFWFTLPLAPVVGSALPFRAGAGHLPGYSGQRQSLVLAHAEPNLARTLQRHLEGYSVEIADGFSQAVALAGEISATAILLDSEAPAIDQESPVPVLRCPLPLANRLAAGFDVDDYLVKPVSREALREAVSRLDAAINRILVVDDDVDFTRLISRMLEEDNGSYLVETAADGEEAMRQIEQNRPDLLLLDLAMPGVDGPALLRRLASEPTRHPAKKIILSAYQEGERNLPLGQVVSIVRPEGFQFQEVVDLIAAALSGMLPPRVTPSGTAPGS